MVRNVTRLVTATVVFAALSAGCGDYGAANPGTEGPPPFGATSTISLRFSECAPTRLIVFNVYGDTMCVPLDSVVCGQIEVELDRAPTMRDTLGPRGDTLNCLAAMASGVYFYKVIRPDTVITKKMVVLR